MKPAVAKLCLKHLDEYAIQFKDDHMVSEDGTIQTFNGMLCDLAPKDVCDWRSGRIAYNSEDYEGFTHRVPWYVARWAGTEINWEPFEEGIRSLPQLRAWLKKQARGSKERG